MLVPGLTDARGQRRRRSPTSPPRCTTVQRVEVLPFHRLGAHKYADLGLAFPLAETAPPTAELLERVRGQFAVRGLTVY